MAAATPTAAAPAAAATSQADYQAQLDASFARQQAFELMMMAQKQRQEESKMVTDGNMSASAAIGDAAQRL